MEISNSNATFISADVNTIPTVPDVKNEEPSYPIFTAAIARALIKGNWKLLDIGPNNKNRDRTVFYFADSLEFRNELGRISKTRAKIKKNAKQED